MSDYIAPAHLKGERGWTDGLIKRFLGEPFIVTSLTGRAKVLYEKVYCARGRMENPGLPRGRL